LALPVQPLHGISSSHTAALYRPRSAFQLKVASL
jgi:hypothetical protein